VTPEPAVAEEPVHNEAGVDESEEFELVLGRRQVASVTFVILVLLAVFSGVSYVAGKATPAPKAEVPARAAAPGTPVLPVVNATIVRPTANPTANPTSPTSAVPAEPPLFASPVPKAIYIQMGAVEKGIAIIFAEGLRKRGFDAFVAPGPSDKIFRVVVGPFHSAEAYQVAKTSMDQIGLSTFSRRYEQQ
jgi:cell division septation protein DedD